MARKEYALLVRVARPAVVAQGRSLKAGESFDYSVRGGTTTDDLNWLTELNGQDFDQRVVQDEPGERAVIIRVTRTR